MKLLASSIPHPLPCGLNFAEFVPLIAFFRLCIHQPRPAIWQLLQKVSNCSPLICLSVYSHPANPSWETPFFMSSIQVMVLSAGHLLYFGEASQALNWFTGSLGYSMPPHTGPADFILDLTNICFSKGVAEEMMIEEQEEDIEGLKHERQPTMVSMKDVMHAAEIFAVSEMYKKEIPSIYR
jgi:hypothetical protein